MTKDIFLIRPVPGMIIQIYIRYCRFDFLHGFCRAMLNSDRYVIFLGGFRRGTNPTMTVFWAENANFGIQLRERYSFDVAPEAAWMSQAKPDSII